MYLISQSIHLTTQSFNATFLYFICRLRTLRSYTKPTAIWQTITWIIKTWKKPLPQPRNVQSSMMWVATMKHVVTWPGPVFCLLLGVSSDYAQPITGQVTEVTCPVIGRAQPKLTMSKRQKSGAGQNIRYFNRSWWTVLLSTSLELRTYLNLRTPVLKFRYDFNLRLLSSYCKITFENLCSTK